MATGRQIFPKTLTSKPTKAKVKTVLVGWNNISSFVHRGLTELLEQDLCTDFEIVTKRKSFRCHKVVLACASDYFKAMFGSGMKETELNKVSFEDIDAETFETLFSILYRRDYMDNPLAGKTDRQMSDLYVLTIRLQMNFLETVCAQYFHETMSIQNCVERWRLGKESLCEEVLIKNIAWAFITDHFADLENDDLFLCLELEDFKALISDPVLSVPNERQVWRYIQRWILVSEEERKIHLESLIQECCLTQIDRDFLMEEVAFDPIVRENKAASQIVQEMIKFKNHPGCHGNMELKFRKIHSKDQSTVMLYRPEVEDVSGEKTAPLHFSAWNRDSWTNWCPLEKAGQYSACCVYGESLFVLTGFYFAYRRAALFEFNGKTRKWTSLKEMSAPLVGHTLSATNGSVYALGGRSHQQQNLRVYQYRVGKLGEQWRNAGEIMANVMFASSVSHDNKIYIFGGEIDGAPADCVQVYDAEEQFGSVYYNLPRPCRWSRVLCRAANAYLVSMNGDVIHISIEDGSSKLVTTIQRFNRINFGISLRNGKLSIFGGRKLDENHEIRELETTLLTGTNHTLTDEVFVVELSSGNVSQGPRLPEPRDVVCCADLVHSV